MTTFETTILKSMQDKAFVSELIQHKTPQDIQSFLASKGINCTEEQIKQLGATLKEKLPQRDLSAEELEGVAGGGVFDLLHSLAGTVWDWIETW